MPRALVHCDTPRLALFDAVGREYGLAIRPGHTTTREELDGTIGEKLGEVEHVLTHRRLHEDDRQVEDDAAVDIAHHFAGCGLSSLGVDALHRAG